MFANMALHPPSSLEHIKRQLPPTPTPPGQNVHPSHNALQHQNQQAQVLSQQMGQHNHVTNVSNKNISKGLTSKKLYIVQLNVCFFHI